MASLAHLVLLGLLLIAAGAGPGSVLGAAGTGDLRLMMVEEAGCRFCAKWDADVGAHYAGSQEGRHAPLVRLARDAPELASFKPTIYTPTFILVQNDREVGRITGYPGRSFFWEELGMLLHEAGVDPPPRERQSEAQR